MSVDTFSWDLLCLKISNKIYLQIHFGKKIGFITFNIEMHTPDDVDNQVTIVAKLIHIKVKL